jgi:hypothetical protein
MGMNRRKFLGLTAGAIVVAAIPKKATPNTDDWITTTANTGFWDEMSCTCVNFNPNDIYYPLTLEEFKRHDVIADYSHVPGDRRRYAPKFVFDPNV